MNLNPSCPTDRFFVPHRSVWLSYLVWVGMTSISSIGMLGIGALMAEQSIAASDPSFTQSPIALQAVDRPSFSAPTLVHSLSQSSVTAAAQSSFADASSWLESDRYIVEQPHDALTPILTTESSVSLAEPLQELPQELVEDDTWQPRQEVPQGSDSRPASLPIPVAHPELETGQHDTAENVTPEDETLETQNPAANSSPSASQLMGVPLIRTQAAIILEGDDLSARARLTGSYPISPNVMVGATVDLTTGNAFTDSQADSLNLNELYISVAPDSASTLRFTVGLLDLTSYFDRNSFAKDSVTHFLNPVFQTNPALASAGIGSRPALLVNWTPVHQLDLKVAAFSSDRNLGDLALDGVAGEIGLRLGNLILRGTFSSDTDSGEADGFREIFQSDRGNGDFGLKSDDREDAFGLNAEYFIPELNLGLFGRYGWYENRSLDRGGETFSVGVNALDLFLPDDRLGLAYGQQLSNHHLRDESDKTPDVVELFYDARLLSFLRVGVSVQSLNQFSETLLGLRLRADFDLTGPRGVFR